MYIFSQFDLLVYTMGNSSGYSYGGGVQACICHLKGGIPYKAGFMGTHSPYAKGLKLCASCRFFYEDTTHGTKQQHCPCCGNTLRVKQAQGCKTKTALKNRNRTVSKK